VLRLRVKEIGIHGKQIKLYSHGGNLWVSKPSDIEKFQRRVRREKITCRKQLNYVRKGDNPIATVDMDFWP
jgi:hypothetical protein